MKKKSMVRMAMVLTLLLSMLFATVSTAHADGTPTPTPGELQYLENGPEEGKDVLKDQTDSFQNVASSVYKFMLLALNSICVIALIVIGVMALFGLGEPQTKVKMKSAAITVVIVLIIGNGAVNIVYWGMRLAKGIF